MERSRLAVVLRKLNEAHEVMTSGRPDWSASDLRMLETVDAAIETCLSVMAQNRAIETATKHHGR